MVRANAGMALEGMIALHERDGRGWKAEWLILPEISLLTGAALRFAARLLEGLQVHADRMRANLDAQRGYLLSEPVMRALARADRQARRARGRLRRRDGRARPRRRPRRGALRDAELVAPGR